jgi:transposase, IS5 family
MKKKRTRREKFLDEMERIVPWARSMAVIEPLYPSSGRVGRQPIGVPRMLRMYCLHVWTRRLLQAQLGDSEVVCVHVSGSLVGQAVSHARSLDEIRAPRP